MGDEVIGATINKTGAFKFRTTKVGKDTALAQIVKMVQDRQNSKAPIAEFADTVSGYFVPIVMILAVWTFVIWFVISPTAAIRLCISNQRDSAHHSLPMCASPWPHQ